MGKQQFTIDGIPVGPNGPNGLLRMHWRARQKYFHTWIWVVRAAITFSPAIAAKVFNRVKIHQVRPRALDMDNLTASCKPILDALVKLRLIYDDSPKWIELIVTQETGNPHKTIITIETNGQ